MNARIPKGTNTMAAKKRKSRIVDYRKALCTNRRVCQGGIRCICIVHRPIPLYLCTRSTLPYCGNILSTEIGARVDASVGEVDSHSHTLPCGGGAVKRTNPAKIDTYVNECTAPLGARGVRTNRAKKDTLVNRPSTPLHWTNRTYRTYTPYRGNTDIGDTHKKAAP